MERKNPSTAGTVNWDIYIELGYKTKIVDYHHKILIFTVFFNTANQVMFDFVSVVFILPLFLQPWIKRKYISKNINKGQRK